MANVGRFIAGIVNLLIFNVLETEDALHAPVPVLISVRVLTVVLLVRLANMRV